MITPLFRVRLDLKGSITYRKADQLLERCHEALYSEATDKVESMSGNGVCAPYIEVVVENNAQAERIEEELKAIIGRWLDK